MRGTPFLMEGWTGGLNTIANPYEVAQSESRNCLNVVSTTRGAIRKRYGSAQFVPTGTQLNKLTGFELVSMFPVLVGGIRYLLVASANKIWSITMLGVVTEIGKGFASGKWSMVQAPKSTGVAGQGPVYMVNGQDAPQYWAGAGEEVKPWTGVVSSEKREDGVLNEAGAEGGTVLKSETAKFTASMVGLVLKFESTVEVFATELGPAGEEIKKYQTVVEPLILAVNPNGKEVTLAFPVETQLRNPYTGVKFKVEQSFYSTVEHVPNGKYMIFFGNRIWMTGITADPSAVWFSELVPIGEGGAQADPSAWPSTNVVRFDSSDENPITAIGHVGPYILTFKENKTWAIHDINTGANRRISTSIGCVANRSVVEGPNGTFFLTKDSGIYLTNGSTVTEMSYLVRPTILGIDPAIRANAAGAYFENHYYLSYGPRGETQNTKTLDYDLVLKSWWLHDLAGPCWAVQEPTSGKETLFLLPHGTSKAVAEAFKEGIYTDLEATYTGNGTMGAYFITNWESFAYYIFRHRVKAPMLKKRVRQIFFNGEGKIIPAVFKDFREGETQEPGVVGNNEIATSAELPIDFASGEEKWGVGSGEWGVEVEGTEKLWGGETTVGQARIYAPGVAFNWSVGWGNNSADPFVVDAFVYMATFRKS